MSNSKRVRNTALWLGVGVLFFVGLIILLSTTGDKKKGEALIDDPGALLGTVITSLSTLLVILLPILLRSEKNTEIAKEQLQNDHKKSDGTPLNLRDDLDDKHDVILTKLDMLQGGVETAIRLSEGNAADIRGMRRDVGRVQDTIADNTKEIARVSRIATGVVRTVDTLSATVQKHHPEGE